MAEHGEQTFGTRVRDRRTELNMTLRELARRIDKAPSYVNDIEYDRRVPSEPVVRRICEVLSLDVDVMLAAAGRVGEGAEQYMRSQPTAGVLFRRVSEAGLGEQDLRQLLRQVDQLSERQRRSEQE